MSDSQEQPPISGSMLEKRREILSGIKDLGANLPKHFDSRNPDHQETVKRLFNDITEMIKSLPGGEHFNVSDWDGQDEQRIFWMDKEPDLENCTEIQVNLVNKGGEHLGINVRTGDPLGEEVMIQRNSANKTAELFLILSDGIRSNEYIGRGWYKDNNAFTEFNHDRKIDNYRDRTFESRPPQTTVDLADLVKSVVGS